jgi:hypothetical protein
VITGSRVQLLHHLLGHGPLMGRFDVVPVLPFDAADCSELAELIWEETKTEAQPDAATRVYRLTQGHPFYADVTCREAAALARQLERPITSAMIDGAFVAAIHRPQGQISIACQEMYDSLSLRTPGLRGFLDALAIHEPATVAEVASRLGLSGQPSVYRFAAELTWLGLVEETDTRGYVFTDPIFRYWVARANDPAARPPADFDPAALRRIARSYEEAYLRERDLHGPLGERYLRDLCRAFQGQQVDGRRLGAPGGHVRLPMVEEVTSIEATDPTGAALGKPGGPTRVELDLCFGTDAVWLGEVKRTTERATAADVLRLVRKAAFLRRVHHLPPGPSWLVSFHGFDRSARDAARANGVYLSGPRNLKAIRAFVGTRR